MEEGALHDIMTQDGISFNAYFLLCLVAAGLPCLATITLWSEWGYGERCMQFLESNRTLAVYCAAFMVVLVATLYMLDFFCPPHLPGHFLTFSSKDRVTCFLVMGHLGVGVVGMSLFFSAKYPYLPAIVTVLCGPCLMATIRCATRQESLPQVSGPGPKTGAALQQLASMKSQEFDTRQFYAGAMSAFIVSGAITVIGWILWAMTAGIEVGSLQGNLEEERRYVRYVTPLMAGLANIALGCISMLRVSLGEDYEGTDNLRVDLIGQLGESAQLDTPEALVARALRSHGTLEAFRELDEKDQKMIAKEEINNMLGLFKTMKVIGCCFLTLLGCLYVAAELLAADSHVAQLVLGVVGVTFLCFLALLFASFGRLMATTKDWFLECPLGRMLLALSDSDWVRAGLVFAAAPAVPFVLLLSLANQHVRKCRGLYTQIPPRPSSAFEKRAIGAPAGANGQRASAASLGAQAIEVDSAPQDQLFTERVMCQLQSARRWNRISIIQKVFVLEGAFVCYILCPRLLNVVLSWLSTILKDGVPFPVILLLTLIAGITCFLLPPVPGLPVYLFSGVIVARTSPFGFWWGCFISIVLGLVLKLSACAMQQKLIGEALGSSIWIRSQVGVNKPFFRAVERILTKPGISWGKVAILCGGPDWPTSVLCGLLRCSVLQMELGTLPIIIFIAPCTLCGAFYLNVDKSEVWRNATNLMVALSIVINMVFGVGAAWAVQDELDASHWEVTKPMEKYIDLDWLDHRNIEILKSCEVQWEEVPVCIRSLALICAAIEICIGHVLYWWSSGCFGTFNITDDINTLIWYGPEGLFKPLGVAGLGLAAFCFVGFVALLSFLREKSAEPQAAKAAALANCEATWKEQRRCEAAAAESRAARSASELLRMSSRTSRDLGVLIEPGLLPPGRRIDKE